MTWKRIGGAEVEVNVHAFLIYAEVGGEWSCQHSGTNWTGLNEVEKKIPPVAGSRTLVIQSIFSDVDSNYPELWAIVWSFEVIRSVSYLNWQLSRVLLIVSDQSTQRRSADKQQ
jgi:hypothetical protein